MKLQDIIDQLRVGEFSQLSIGGQQPGDFNENNYQNVISHVNLGLTTLYRRFNLKEGHVSLVLQPGQYLYPITSSFAINNKRSREPVRYLEDSAQAPFQDDIHKILRVVNDFDRDMKLNDAADLFSCMTPSMTSLQVPRLVVNQDPLNTPYWLRTERLKLVYQANHPILTIPIGFFDPTRVNIELPYSHLEALLYFVASRVNNPIGMSNEFHAGNNYAAKFEAACLALENAGMEIDQGTGNNRLRQKGFV